MKKKNMKFISKQAILRVILRPGIPGNKLAGTPAIAALSVRFENGEASTESAEIIELLKQSEAFKNGEILCADDEMSKIKKGNTMEPEHMITEIHYGHPVGQTNPRTPMTQEMMTDMIKKIAMEQAKSIAMEMAPVLARELLKKEGLTSSKSDDNNDVADSKSEDTDVIIEDDNEDENDNQNDVIDDGDKDIVPKEEAKESKDKKNVNPKKKK